ncbi:competence/damage-inducible protein A [Yunchengibacter salinarum]|uniref:competence/damage-inducible protein A n=1 Tax=Yunchengibacter salinarum TaxID=3133399 RepID=UPI0035B59145
MASDRTYTAALLIIGDEILSGRTQDANLPYLAQWLNARGIQMVEARVVPDDRDEIVHAVNTLRGKVTYLFTTGGIGPTHDDITAACIADAFGVDLPINRQAFARLEAHYGADNFTAARQRMARIPEGGELIDNPVSVAPGFRVENVYTLAGVPKIMQSMLDHLDGRIEGGRTVHSKALTLHVPESRLAGDIGALQDRHPDVGVGSYPFFHQGEAGVQVVIRSPDEAALEAAMDDLLHWVDDKALPKGAVETLA